MPAIPEINTTMVRIVARTHKNEFRPYLGMSEAGKECPRYLWYCLHWAFDSIISDTVKRLFERGHDEEDRVIHMLNVVGVEVTRRQAEVSAVHGYVEGHIDGIASGLCEAPHIEHLLEIKTHNDRSFKDLQNKGVGVSKPTHLAQMQLYMGALGLKWALYFAVNKNNDDIYLERVQYEEDIYGLLLERLEGIITSELPPQRIGDYDYHTCRICDAKGICHFDGPLEINCRTCVQCDMHEGNAWHCTNTGRATFYPERLSVEQQRTGCLQHRPITT